MEQTQQEGANNQEEEIEIKPCIHCGCTDIHPKRVEFLIKYKKSITCIDCAEGRVKKVTGFQVNHDKACREIQVCDETTGQRLMKFQRKTGQATGGPGFGLNAGKVVYKK